MGADPSRELLLHGELRAEHQQRSEIAVGCPMRMVFLNLVIGKVVMSKISQKVESHDSHDSHETTKEASKYTREITYEQQEHQQQGYI